MPELTEIDGLPQPFRDADAERLASVIAEVGDEVSAGGVLIVWERDGDSTLTPADLVAMRMLSSRLEAADVPVRAWLLSHSDACREVTQQEVDSGPPVS